MASGDICLLRSQLYVGAVQTIAFAQPHFSLIFNCSIPVHSSGFYEILECAGKQQGFAICTSTMPAQLSTEARDGANVWSIGRRRGVGSQIDPQLASAVHTSVLSRNQYAYRMKHYLVNLFMSIVFEPSPRCACILVSITRGNIIGRQLDGQVVYQ